MIIQRCGTITAAIPNPLTTVVCRVSKSYPTRALQTCDARIATATKPSPSLLTFSFPSMALHYAFAPLRLGPAAVTAPSRRVSCTASILASASASTPKARFFANRTESATVQQLQRPLGTCEMSFFLLCIDLGQRDERETLFLALVRATGHSGVHESASEPVFRAGCGAD